MTNPVQSGDLGSFSQAKIPTEQTDKPVVSGPTPGPWTLTVEKGWPFGLTIETGDREEVVHLRRWAHSTTQKTVADCRAAVGFKPKERPRVIEAIARQEANARLIAAAPDLLEALTDVLNHSGARGSYHALKYADAVEKAEAALRKATGETQ